MLSGYSRTLPLWLFGVSGATAVAVVWAAPASAPAANPRAVFDQYCITCHNQKLKTAGLMLDKLDAANPAANPEIWEKVIRKLRAGSMPPAGMPRPDAATYRAVATAGTL